MALITFLFALNLPIDTSGAGSELTRGLQNMLLSLTKTLWLIAFLELCAAGFIAYVIHIMKLKVE